MATPIILIGPPASGKSTVGRALSYLMKGVFLDTDRMVETHTGRPSVGHYFTEVGERTFRATERQVLTRALLSTILNSSATCPVVIATGAGAIEDPRNREDMRSFGIPVCLFAPVSVLHARMAGDDTRPLWTGPGGKEALRERWARRAPMYQEAARYIVNALAPPASVATKIIRCAGHG